MTLTAMLAKDRDALACDLWETYQVRDLEALPVETLAVLSCGLRENSRIKMLMSGQKERLDMIIMAGCYDMLAGIKWMLAGATGEAPASMARALLGIEVNSESEIVSCATPEEWERERRRIINNECD